MRRIQRFLLANLDVGRQCDHCSKAASELQPRLAEQWFETQKILQSAAASCYKFLHVSSLISAVAGSVANMCIHVLVEFRIRMQSHVRSLKNRVFELAPSAKTSTMR